VDVAIIDIAGDHKFGQNLVDVAIVEIARDHKYASINDLVVILPTALKIDWVAALIKRNIRILKEKIRSLCHSLPFERMPGITVVHMVLYIVKFVYGFPRRGDVKHYSPGEFIMVCCLNANNLKLSYGVYCKVASNFEPRNSLARTRAVISLGNSGNNLNFPERHGRKIGDHPQDIEPSRDDSNAGCARRNRNSRKGARTCKDVKGYIFDDDGFVIVEFVLDVIPGVDPTPEDDDAGHAKCGRNSLHSTYWLYH
jgi:hypothetical protein